MELIILIDDCPRNRLRPVSHKYCEESKCMWYDQQKEKTAFVLCSHPKAEHQSNKYERDARLSYVAKYLHDLRRRKT